MHPRVERYRKSWRLRIPPDPGETRRIERWLATARVFLAVSALGAIYMDPTQAGHTPIATALLAAYLVHGVIVMMLLRLRQHSTPNFRLFVHAGDVVWPALILVFAAGSGSRFFLFFFFVLAAAAYRWGLWETLGTAAVEVGILWVGNLILVHARLDPADALLGRLLSGARASMGEFQPQRLFILSIYLIIMGLLLGYLAEQQKHLRAEKAVVTGTLSRIRVEAGLTGTMNEIFGELMKMYGASKVLIASQDNRGKRVFVGELSRAKENASPDFRWLESATRDAKIYLSEFPGEVCCVSPRGQGWKILALDADGHPVPTHDLLSIPQLREVQAFQSFITVVFHSGSDWEGRIFLFDPVWSGETQEELRFLLDLVRQVGPAVYNVYLLHRLRRRASAAERARFARELHDGAVQSLIAVEMQVDVIRRQAESNVPIEGELARIQSLLREEVLKLRELMQQMKAIDVDADRLLGVLRDTVERFQRETGITARFVTDLEELDMPQRVCREILRIVQESLVNVRKHSGARHALVRLSSNGEKWNLTVEDDGRGFEFAGRYNHEQMEEEGKGPLIIKERVRLIAGELTVESTPGQGTRLEITVPRNGEVTHAF